MGTHGLMFRVGLQALVMPDPIVTELSMACPILIIPSARLGNNFPSHWLDLSWDLNLLPSAGVNMYNVYIQLTSVLLSRPLPLNGLLVSPKLAVSNSRHISWYSTLQG